MAEFQEIVQEFHRLCETQRRLHKNSCDKCPVKIATMGTMFQCYRYVLEEPKETENIIMSWAAEHPEPVYPTWGDWLEEQGVVTDMKYWYVFNDKMMKTSISANIAQKLGIEPKEG